MTKLPNFEKMIIGTARENHHKHTHPHTDITQARGGNICTRRLSAAALILASTPLAVTTADFSAVPVVDLLEDEASTVSTVLGALRKFGFFYVFNHGVDPALIEAQFVQSRDLFALPAAMKETMPVNGTLDIGYLGSGGQALDEEGGIGDTKEGFMLTNNGVFNPSFTLSADDPLAGAELHWPPRDVLPNYERILRAYTAALSSLNHRLNALLFRAVGLGESERRALAAQPFTVTKQMRYTPSQSQRSGELGAGAHADGGALTIRATDGQPGLEVEHPDGGWLPVPPRRAASSSTRATRSRTGRTATCAAPTTASWSPRGHARYSTAFFTYFDLHATVSALPSTSRTRNRRCGRRRRRSSTFTSSWPSRWGTRIPRRSTSMQSRRRPRARMSTLNEIETWRMLL